MLLNVDTSRALRSPGELLTLVQSILTAGPNDESTWVEWKSGLLLVGKENRLEIARHILGMANRDPESAAHHAEGCAYVVIGAEPGNCDGVTEIDPADLDSGLQPYLGSEGPRWSPQYIMLQGKSMLVITVDPPRRGHRAFTLQKGFKNYLAGMVFVRRPGKTIQAEPGDIRMLEDRYAAVTQPIALRVRPAGADDSLLIRPVGNLGSLLNAWESRARRELAPPPPRNPDSPNAPLYGLFAQIENMSKMSSMLGGLTSEDQRTDAEFEEEIAEYVKASHDYYARLAFARLGELGVSQMPMELSNASDRGYADVRVKVSVPSSVYVMETEPTSGMPEAPRPPHARGTRIAKLPFSIHQPSYLPPFTYAPTLAPPFFDIERGGEGTVVTYDFRRVRAEDRITLDPVLSLICPADVTESQEISWTVTTSNVDGIARGRFAVRVGEPITAADLVPELLPEDHS